MEAINQLVGKLGSFAWGPIMIVLLLGTGILVSIGTKFVQLRKLGYAFKLLVSKSEGEGDITPFQSLMTSLAATIGTGNIAGVATAIASGGPGAVFWMWVTAVFGGATKFSEGLLALKFREKNENGEMSGGPMYYIKNGMGEQWKWLAFLFALFGAVAAFGIGNMVQSNSVASSIKQSFNLSPIITGVVIAVATGAVILGGIKSIAKVTDKLVPIMAVIYVIGSLIVLGMHADKLGAAFGMIFSNAFNAKAVGGGLIGTVIRYGVARGIFSNEAGLGSAPIAHAASKNTDHVKQGIIASLGSFIDTLVICSMTALVILVSGLVQVGQEGMMLANNAGELLPMSAEGVLKGADLTTKAFNVGLPGGAGGFIVTFGLIFFAFSTILGWYYYGSKCVEYIFGVKSIIVYKYLWVIFVFIGAVTKLGFVWNISDAFNGLMAIPNLIAIIALSGFIFKSLKEYEEKL